MSYYESRGLSTACPRHKSVASGWSDLQLTFESREVITWPISYHEGEVSYHDPLSRGWSTRED